MTWRVEDMAPIDLRSRSTQSELMDTEPVTFEEFQHCLRDLEKVNIATFAYRPTLSWLGRAVRRRSGTAPVTVLDVGSGHGDMLRRIWRWAARRGIPVALTGLDLNPFSERAARLATPAEAPIRYETGDIFALDPERRFDIVISALFAHHLTDPQLSEFIRMIDRTSRVGWFINDIHRHLLPYVAVKYGLRLARLNRMVQNDGPISVTRAFTRADWERLLTAAGIGPSRVEVAWYALFRYGVGCVK